MVCLAVLAIAACGNKGPLKLPPSTSNAPGAGAPAAPNPALPPTAPTFPPPSAEGSTKDKKE